MESNNHSSLACDYFDGVLDYINQMLMEEEEDLENRPCMLQDSLALQATEKSFYDALSEDQQLIQHTCVNYCTEKGQKYPQGYEDFSHSVEGETNNKRLASCSEGLDQTQLYDKTLLCSSKNPGFYSDPCCCQSTNDGSIEEQLAYKPLYFQPRMPKRGRPRAGAEQVVANALDLGSLLTQCAQALANYDIRIAHEKLKLIRLHCSPYGEATERMSHYFADALEARLAGTGVELYTASARRTMSAADILKAFQVRGRHVLYNKFTVILNSWTLNPKFTYVSGVCYSMPIQEDVLTYLLTSQLES